MIVLINITEDIILIALSDVLQKLNSKFQKKNVKPSNIHSISAYEVFIFQLNSCLAI